MEQHIKELERRLAQIEEQYKKLANTATIPFEVENALRDRLTTKSTVAAELSSKGANSEDVTVNEAGSGSYAVMNDPVGFIKLSFNGADYYVPYFNA